MDLATMVETQIVARGIRDSKLLEVMRSVPRDFFVLDKYKEFAFSDQPLPIGYEQTISQPYIVGLMTELLELKGNEIVLEIGTGCGYQTAILSKLSKKVYSLERISTLAKLAQEKLRALDCDNVEVKCCDGFLGLESKGPFDAIIVTCAPREIPECLVRQLSENGRLVVPVGSLFQQLKIVERKRGETYVTNSLPVRFVPMLKGVE